MKRTNRILAFLLVAAILLGFYVPGTAQAATQPIEERTWEFNNADDGTLSNWTLPGGDKYWSFENNALRCSFNSAVQNAVTGTFDRAANWKQYNVSMDVTIHSQQAGRYPNVALITCLGGSQQVELRLIPYWNGQSYNFDVQAILVVGGTTITAQTLYSLSRSETKSLSHKLELQISGNKIVALVDGDQVSSLNNYASQYNDVVPGGLQVKTWRNYQDTESTDKDIKVDIHSINATVYDVHLVNGTLADKSEPDFTDDFEDGIADYWVEDNGVDKFTVAENPSGNGNAYKYTGTDYARSWLHVFETNVDYTAKVYVPTDAGSGKVGLIARMTGLEVPGIIEAGYDFGSNNWFVKSGKGAVSDYGEPVLKETSGTLTKGEWHKFRITVYDRVLSLYCDDALVMTAPVEQITTGRVGVFAEGVSAAYFDDVALVLFSNQGRVESAVLENYVLDNHPSREGTDAPYYADGGNIFRVDENTLLFNVRGFLYKSTDNGVTFAPIAKDSAEYGQYAFFAQSLYAQYVRLHNGDVLKLIKTTGDVMQAWLSKDNGVSYDVVNTKIFSFTLDGVINNAGDNDETAKVHYYYGSQNDKVKEINLGDIDGDGWDNYRVFYCVDVRTTGAAGNTGSITSHWQEIYYSDDCGYTWQKAENDTRWYSAMGETAESLIIPVRNADGSLKCLRMLCSWNDAGSVRYFDSYDYGRTWSSEKALPKLSNGQSSHAYAIDPETGYIYYVLLYGEPASLTGVDARNRFVMLRSADGEKWDYMMDLWRWEDVPDDALVNVNQVVNPSITIDGDIIYVTSGWSEKMTVEVGGHYAQRQTVLRLDKNKLTAYDAFPDLDKNVKADDIVRIEVTAPTDSKYLLNEAVNLSGGSLTVYYYDGSTAQMALTDEAVTISRPDASWLWSPDFATEDYPLTAELGTQWIRVEYQNFADGFYIQVGQTEDDLSAQPTRAYRDAALEDKISLNYHMAVPTVMANDSGLYMKFVVGGNETIVYLKDAAIDAEGNYVFTVPVAAKELSDTITAQLYNSVDEDPVYSDTYTVKEYLTYIYNHKDEEAYKAAAPIAEALLNYGAAAQIHFKYNTSDLANEDIGGFGDGWNSGIDVNALAKYAPKVSGTLPTGVEFYGSSVIMEDRTTIRYYLRMDAETAKNIHVTLYGKELALRKSGSYYCVDVLGVDAANLDLEFTVDITDGVNTYSVTYSALGYVYQILSSGRYTEDSTMYQLAQALYLYNRAAEPKLIPDDDEFEILPF